MRALAAVALLLAIALSGCDTRALDQPDAFAVRVQNDLTGPVVLALCNDNQCDSPYYRDPIARGSVTEENITPDLKTEWAVEAPDGLLLRCVLLYWKYAPSHSPTVQLSASPKWSSPCSRKTTPVE